LHVIQNLKSVKKQLLFMHCVPCAIYFWNCNVERVWNTWYRL